MSTRLQLIGRHRDAASAAATEGVFAEISKVVTVADNISDVETVSDNMATINANQTAIAAVGGNIADVQAVAANESDIDTVAANMADVNFVAGVQSDIAALQARESAMVSVSTSNGTDSFGNVYGSGVTIITFENDDELAVLYDTFCTTALATSSGNDSFGKAYVSGDVIITFPTAQTVAISQTDESAEVVVASSSGTSTNGVAYSNGDEIIEFPNGDTWANAPVPAQKGVLVFRSNSTSTVTISTPTTNEQATILDYTYNPTFANSDVVIFATVNGDQTGTVANGTGLYCSAEVRHGSNGGSSSHVSEINANGSITSGTNFELYNWASSYSWRFTSVNNTNQSVQLYMRCTDSGQNTSNFINKRLSSLIVIETEL